MEIEKENNSALSLTNTLNKNIMKSSKKSNAHAAHGSDSNMLKEMLKMPVLSGHANSDTNHSETTSITGNSKSKPKFTMNSRFASPFSNKDGTISRSKNTNPDAIFVYNMVLRMAVLAGLVVAVAVAIL